MSPLLDINSEIFLQYGFAGVSAVLFGILIWLIKALLSLQKDTNKVIEKNTSANNRIVDLQEKQLITIDALKEKLISRPCIARREQDG